MLCAGVSSRMDAKIVQKMKTFLKRNSSVPYETMKDVMLHKTQQWKYKGDMGLNQHYFMIAVFRGFDRSWVANFDLGNSTA